MSTPPPIFSNTNFLITPSRRSKQRNNNKTKCNAPVCRPFTFCTKCAGGITTSDETKCQSLSLQNVPLPLQRVSATLGPALCAFCRRNGDGLLKSHLFACKKKWGLTVFRVCSGMLGALGVNVCAFCLGNKVQFELSLCVEREMWLCVWEKLTFNQYIPTTGEFGTKKQNVLYISYQTIACEIFLILITLLNYFGNIFLRFQVFLN